jgi:hypothetical protein
VTHLSIPDRIDVGFTAGLDSFVFLWTRERNLSQQQRNHGGTSPSRPDWHPDTSTYIFLADK